MTNNKTVATGCGAVILVLVVLAVVFLPLAWLIMIVAGACGWHIGFLPSIGLSVLVSLVLGGGSRL